MYRDSDCHCQKWTILAALVLNLLFVCKATAEIKIHWHSTIDPEDTLHDIEFNPSSIRLSGQAILVGEDTDDEGNFDAGAVHGFSWSGNNIVPNFKLTGTSQDEHVGRELFLVNNTVFTYSKNKGVGWHDQTLQTSGNLNTSFVNGFCEVNNYLLVWNAIAGNSPYSIGEVDVYNKTTREYVGKVQSWDYLNPSRFTTITTTDGVVNIPQLGSYYFGTDVTYANGLVLISSPGAPVKIGDQWFDAGAVYVYNENDLFGEPIQRITYTSSDLSIIGKMGADIEKDGSAVYILSELTGSKILIFKYELVNGSYVRTSTLDVNDLISAYTGKIISMQGFGFKVRNGVVYLSTNESIFAFAEVGGQWVLQTFNKNWGSGYNATFEIDDNGYIYMPRDTGVWIYKTSGTPENVDLSYLLEPQTTSSGGSGSGGGGCLLKTGDRE